VTTGKSELIGVRCHKDFLAALDVWRAQQEGEVSRPDAIRRLAELALASTKPMRTLHQKAIAKASDIAGKQIDRMSDGYATDDERASRKRRLLKGPKEFRDIRSDLPMPKATR
jgi:hypothetical protein